MFDLLKQCRLLRRKCSILVHFERCLWFEFFRHFSFIINNNINQSVKSKSLKQTEVAENNSILFAF